MSNKSEIPETLHMLAEQAGLKRAFKMFPDDVKAAAERGHRPIGAMPPGNPPLTHPAQIFGPEQNEVGE
jgi:hypothetical protein